MRVYLPATLPVLAQAHGCGGFEAGHAAHSVTAAIREWYVAGDVEELEYAAFTEAGQASLHLLAAEPGYDTEPRLRAHYENRRVVVAADVEPGALLPGAASGADVAWRSAVRLAVPVPLAAWASVHLDAADDAAARAAVAAALQALPAALAGDEDAQFALDEAEAHELAWYDLTELADLL